MIDLIDRPNDLAGMLIALVLLIYIGRRSTKWLIGRATIGIDRDPPRGADDNEREVWIELFEGPANSPATSPATSPVPGSAASRAFYSSLVYGSAAGQSSRVI